MQTRSYGRQWSQDAVDRLVKSLVSSLVPGTVVQSTQRPPVQQDPRLRALTVEYVRLGLTLDEARQAAQLELDGYGKDE